MKPNDIRCTPPALVREVAELVGVDSFELDVAASPGNAVALEYYALEDGQDGLKLDWFGHVWCNPPYSEIGKWVAKAAYEWSFMRCCSITMLLPANRTEQAWWQDGVEGHTEIAVHFLRKRRRFLMPDGSPILDKNGKVGAPKFGLVVLIWGHVDA